MEVKTERQRERVIRTIKNSSARKIFIKEKYRKN